MRILACRVRLTSSMRLEEVGEILSRHVFGGIPFEGKSRHIRDEIPAIYNKTELFGMRFILTGEEGVVYYLEADACHSVMDGLSTDND
jgi:hypothetical protein